MLEKFTEKAINIVTEAQNQAKLMQNVLVQPEHFLLAISKLAKGISLKIFKMYNIDFDNLRKVVEEKLRFEKSSKIYTNPYFSPASKDLLKRASDLADKSGNSSILFEHVFIAVLNDKNSYISRVLERFNFDTYKVKDTLSRLVQKKVSKIKHPEGEDVLKNSELLNVENLLNGSNEIFNNALSKLSASKYEILGTEQILSSILENKDSELVEILSKLGLTSQNFEEKLNELENRDDEFEGKQIIFTPNAFIAMNNAINIAKEMGFSKVTPSHLILGILKSKKGIAYKILKQLNVLSPDFEKAIISPIEKQTPEISTIIKFAKEEARRIGRNTVGTEMLLLGIIEEGNGIGYKVLNELEITIKDVRKVIENIVGYGDEYFDSEITFTKRAKKVLETAWQLVKKRNELKIESDHLLYAITCAEDCVAMRVLEQLGVDVIEIKQGIIFEKQKRNK
ncbi:hypothetical protein IJG72_07260 [bacterium]|nr:hypothetical protein [bacterium]